MNRRTFLTTAAALTTAPNVSLAQQSTTRKANGKATFVFVPGGLHGGWCWKRVAARLRARGHEVFTPTLTGLGERAHLMSPSVNLETHIADIMGVLEWEDLRGVILVGHSYGGMVITGVADRAPDRLARLVYLDALWPDDGESVVDLIGPEAVRRVGSMQIDPARPPMIRGAVEFAKQMGPTDPGDIAWLASKLTPMPPATQTQSLRLKQSGVRVPVLFIACMKPPSGPPQMAYARAKKRATIDSRVRTVELMAPHDAMVTHPGELVEVLTAKS